MAWRLGAPNEPDGIVEIPQSGKPNLRISIEAKGSKGVITHKELRQATVERHSGDQACSHAVAVAREFAVDGIGGKESALLRETKGKVPLLTTGAIAKLLRLHKARPFTFDKVAEILTTWQNPTNTEQFIEDIWRKLPDLGLMRLVLEVAYEHTQKDQHNYPDPGMILGDSKIRSRGVTRDQIRSILEAVQVTTQMIVIRNPQDYQFELLSHPDTIIEAFQAVPTQPTLSPTDAPTS